MAKENAFTAWNVITGAPCSGKTTVIEELERRGFRCQREAARCLIEERRRLGEALEVIRGDEASFQAAVVRRKIEIEASLNPDETIFFDRGIPDSLSFYRICGLNVADIFSWCRIRCYANVFFFDSLPLIKDDARTEDADTIRKLCEYLVTDYEALGYQLIRVPTVSVRQRVELIMSHLRQSH